MSILGYAEHILGEQVDFAVGGCGGKTFTEGLYLFLTVLLPLQFYVPHTNTGPVPDMNLTDVV